MKNVIAIIVIAVLFSLSTTAVAQEKYFSRQGGDYWPPSNSNNGFARGSLEPSICAQVKQCTDYVACQNAMSDCASLKARLAVVEKDLEALKRCVTCSKPVKKAKVKKLGEDAKKLPKPIQVPFNDRVLLLLENYSTKSDVDALLQPLRDLFPLINERLTACEDKLAELEGRVIVLETRADGTDREQKVQDKRLDKLEKDVGSLMEAFDLEVIGGFALTPKFFGGGGGLGIVYRLSERVHLELTGVVGGGSDYDLDVGGQMVAFGSVNVFYQWKYGAIGGNALAASMKPVETERNTSFSAYGGGLMLRVNTAHENPVRFFITGTVDVVGYSDWDNTLGHPDAIPWDWGFAGTATFGLSCL